MLFLLFQLGNGRYALEATRVVEVLPLVALQRVPHAPRGVAGVFNYRGQPVPTIDLCELTLGQPASERLSTRIIIVNYPGAPAPGRLLGLLAENATTMMRRDEREFVAPGIKVEGVPYLGPVLLDGQNAIQWVHEDRLVTEPLRELLLGQDLALSHEGN